MFYGEHERTLDDKSRLALPVEFRAHLGTGAFLTRSFDNCLCIYPAARWEALARAIDELPQVRYEVRSLARSVFGGAVPCEFDRQGRITVPAFLRDHAGISDEVMIVGVLSRVEVWSKQTWLAERTKLGNESAKMAELLSISGA